MQLSNIECDSTVWKKLKRHLEERLETLRLQNDTVNFEDMQKNQGKIAEIKQLIRLDERKVVEEDHDDEALDE